MSFLFNLLITVLAATIAVDAVPIPALSLPLPQVSVPLPLPAVSIRLPAVSIAVSVPPLPLPVTVGIDVNIDNNAVSVPLPIPVTVGIDVNVGNNGNNAVSSNGNNVKTAQSNDGGAGSGNIGSSTRSIDNSGGNIQIQPETVANGSPTASNDSNNIPTISGFYQTATNTMSPLPTVNMKFYDPHGSESPTKTSSNTPKYTGGIVPVPNEPPYGIDLEDWRLLLIWQRQLSIKVGIALFSVFVLGTTFLFILRSRVDVSLQKHSIPQIMMCSFSVMCVSVPALLTSGWDAQFGGYAIPCIVVLAGDVLGISTLTYFLIIRSLRVHHLINLNIKKVKNSKSSISSLQLEEETQTPDHHSDSISLSPHSSRENFEISWNNAKSTWKGAFMNVFTFKFSPAIEGDDKTMIGYFLLIVLAGAIYVAVAGRFSWAINGNMGQGYCPFGYEYSAVVLLLVGTILFTPFYLYQLSKNKKYAELNDNYGIRRTLTIFSVLGTICGIMIVVWIFLIPSGKIRGEPVTKIIWGVSDWQVTSALILHTLVVIVPLHNSYRTSKRIHQLASALRCRFQNGSDTSLSSEASPDEDKKTISTTKSESNKRSFSSNLSSNAIRKGETTLMNINVNEMREVKRGDAKKSGSLTSSTGGLLRIYESFGIKSSYAKVEENEKEQTLEDFKRFSIKDFTVENPLFYSEWRDLMKAVIMQVTNQPECKFDLVDSLHPAYETGIMWKAHNSEYPCLFPNQSVPIELIEEFESFFARYVLPSSPVAVSLSPIVVTRIQAEFDDHKKFVSRVGELEDEDPMSMNNPLQRVYGVWGPLRIASNGETSGANSPLDKSPNVVALAAATSAAAAAVGSGPQTTAIAKRVESSGNLSVSTITTAIASEISTQVVKSNPKKEAEVIAFARIPQTPQQLKLSVFHKAKEEVLRRMFENTFVRFLETPEANNILKKFRDTIRMKR